MWGSLDEGCVEAAESDVGAVVFGAGKDSSILADGCECVEVWI